MRVEVADKTDKFWVTNGKDGVRYASLSAHLVYGDSKVVTRLISSDFDPMLLDETSDPPTLQDIIACQYELTDGSFLVLTDFSRDRCFPETPWGRLIVNTTRLYFLQIDQEGRLRRERWIWKQHVRWGRKRHAPGWCKVQTLGVAKVEQLSSRRLSVQMRDGKEYRVSFFKNGPRGAPLDAATVFYQDNEFGHLVDTPFRFYRKYHLGWRRPRDFCAFVVDLVFGTPLKLWELIPK